ncbi:hypothetical protein [Patulibacter sp. SYSU D01012]|uniref:hypothetical protein n=1 Tax=Patulibacter sp. SYSU D01012 TaxID=2817381 RepID=UPI001B3188D8|nr:hypothetical protein [Patulibacter sp. SYSU D01012]
MPAPPTPPLPGLEALPPYDPGLPMLAEMEARVLAVATAAIAAEGTAAEGTAAEERRAKRDVARAGRAWPRVLRRAVVLAAIGCTVGATATALTRRGGERRAADVAPRTVLQGRAGGTAWTLRVGRRGGRICPVLSLSGGAAAGAALTTDCRAAPPRGGVVPASAAVPGGLLVAGVAGRRVRRVVVTVGGRRRAATTAPVPGADGLRAFAVAVRGRVAAPVVRPRDAHGRRTGAPARDCAVVPAADGC